MTEEAQNKSESIVRNTSGYVNPSIIKIRLDTKPLLEKLELFLRGTRNYAREIDGEIKIISVQEGIARANEIGVQSIVSYITSVVNPSTGQGNITNEEDFRRFVRDVRIDLVVMLIKYGEQYGVKTRDIEEICNQSVNTIRLFVSRTLFNEERNSFAASLRSLESNTHKESKGWNLFNRGG